MLATKMMENEKHLTQEGDRTWPGNSLCCCRQFICMLQAKGRTNKWILVVWLFGRSFLVSGLVCSGLAGLIAWLAGWRLKDDTININKFIKNFYFANYLLTNDEMQQTSFLSIKKKKNTKLK